ncbi:MAG: nucleoside deaminase [Armatimonadetes bacterium]|nr:nucleoside deaminase [Armatimonadota bacterium]
MQAALQQAQRALARHEVPVGAVLVEEGRLVSTAHNLRETTGDILAHAEMLAMRRAARVKGDWRLSGCTVYVTLEPCALCTGAMLQARVKRLVYGAASVRDGAAGTVLNLADYPGLSHQIEIRGGLLEERSRELLERFFASCRSKYGEVAEFG